MCPRHKYGWPLRAVAIQKVYHQYSSSVPLKLVYNPLTLNPDLNSAHLLKACVLNKQSERLLALREFRLGGGAEALARLAHITLGIHLKTNLV